MPTVKPRVTVTLEPEAYEVLEGMARLGGTTPGRVLTEIASPVLPVLKRLVKASEDYAAWQQQMRDQLADVHGEVAQGVELAIAALERQRAASQAVPALSPVGQGGVASGGPQGAAPTRASKPRSARVGVAPEGALAGTETPHTNRGVRRSPSKQKQRLSKGGPVSGI